MEENSRFWATIAAFVAIGANCFAMGFQAGRPKKVVVEAATIAVIGTGDLIVDKLDSNHTGVVIRLDPKSDRFYVCRQRSKPWIGADNSFDSRYDVSFLANWRKAGE